MKYLKELKEKNRKYHLKELQKRLPWAKIGGLDEVSEDTDVVEKGQKQ